MLTLFDARADELRRVMTEWGQQLPAITRRNTPPFNTGSQGRQHELWQAAMDGDTVKCGELIRAMARNPVWAKCARHCMLVAAFNGVRWSYGDPVPVMPDE